MKALLLSALLLPATLAGAHAQTTPEYFGLADINPGSDLSIREEPDASAAVVARIPWNVRQVRGYGCTNDTPSGLTWCRVKYRGVVGWARRRYLVPAR